MAFAAFDRLDVRGRRLLARAVPRRIMLLWKPSSSTAENVAIQGPNERMGLWSPGFSAEPLFCPLLEPLASRSALNVLAERGGLPGVYAQGEKYESNQVAEQLPIVGAVTFFRVEGEDVGFQLPQILVVVELPKLLVGQMMCEFVPDLAYQVTRREYPHGEEPQGLSNLRLECHCEIRVVDELLEPRCESLQ